MMRWLRSPTGKFATLTAMAFALPTLALQALTVTGTSAAEVLAKSYSIVAPLLEPLLKLSGTFTPSAYVGGMYALFLFFYIQALFKAADGFRLRHSQYDLLARVLGAASRTARKYWLILMTLSLAGMVAIGLLPQIPVTDLETLLLNCGRLGAFLGLGVVTAGAAMLSWQQYTIRKKAAAEAGSLTLEHPIYVALVAEMIQAIGKNDRIPLPYELEFILSQLRELAELSHSRQFEHGDLGPICHKAISLFVNGRLNTLPDLFAAKKLFYRPDPSALFDIAAEIQQRIGTPETEEEPLELLPINPLKDRDGTPA